MDAAPATNLRCSANSLAVGEPLYATASKTDVWILVEYPDVMGTKALKDSSIPKPVIAYLEQLPKDILHSRLLLIKKSNRSSEGALTAFVCIASKKTPALYQTNFVNYEELLSKDILGLVSGSPNDHFEHFQDKLYLVCTNAMRDRCCGLWGGAVFKVASQYAGEAVWQSSHVGGHRFAANLICLPHGLYYGRVRPENANQIIDRYKEHLIDVEHFRGRACYPPEAQAAEYFLLCETSITGIDTFLLEDILIISDEIQEIHFLSNIDGTRYSVRIRIDISDTEIFESCDKPDKMSRPPRYRLEGWKKL